MYHGDSGQAASTIARSGKPEHRVLDLRENMMSYIRTITINPDLHMDSCKQKLATAVCKVMPEGRLANSVAIDSG